MVLGLFGVGMVGTDPTGLETLVHNPVPVPGLFPNKKIEEVQPKDWFEPALALIRSSM